ncbi:shikimate dehydrogenase [Lutibacter sp. HS1-25]|uniref:shikimate dehydrogenase family protein n=1 Tax=Lutibacter sp. HS1-25 TaxID=2485000 RepID=UPI001012A617|nr:shikimate dehydrogenase [Lutibacter sp. HS1-25]RXP53390.1 shikimate dehydrogenase [Lutibacter sp. HS1-25]
MDKRTKFGLLGKNISYSFSRKYFSEKFQELKLTDYKYNNFDIPEIEEFPFLMYQKEHEFGGINVTIPYKEAVMRYLDEIDVDAQKIGAVNTIKITEDNRLVGFNTDFFGFQKSIQPLLKSHHKKALILGTGGASKAVAYAFSEMNIEFKFVSRKVTEGMLLYSMLNEQNMEDYTIIVNCTPIGTHPNIEECPNIPYQFLTDKHLLYDLIYNPEVTKFLSEGQKRGATIKNGLEMLQLQAEKSWEIWNS